MSDKLKYSRGCQPIVDFDAADNCRLYVTTIKAMNFQDHIPSVPIDNSEDHYVLMFDLTLMQDATENCHYPELVGEPLRLELNFTFPLGHVTELILVGERMSSVAVEKFGVVGKKHLKRIIFLSIKESTLAHYSSIGTGDLFPLTMFQLLTTTLSPL